MFSSVNEQLQKFANLLVTVTCAHDTPLAEYLVVDWNTVLHYTDRNKLIFSNRGGQLTRSTNGRSCLIGESDEAVLYLPDAANVCSRPNRYSGCPKVNR